LIPQALPPAPPPPPVPALIIDCTTSARSADELRQLEVPYYRWFGQSTDPESLKTGKIDTSKLIDEITRKMGPDPSGWGMLDYEEPFDAWLELPPTDPRHVQVVSEMVRAIRAVKATFPKVKWTYYGQPRLDRWPMQADGTRKGWPEASPESCSKEIERRITTLGPIIAELDWISPSFYDVYENALFSGEEGRVMLANEERWRIEDARLGREMRRRRGLPQVPVLPCVSCVFQGGGRATPFRPIPVPELLSDQVQPGLAGGVDGFTMWSGVDFAVMVATLPPDHKLDASDQKVQQESRTAWQPFVPKAKTPIEWTDDMVRFELSQRVGDVVTAAAKAIKAAVSQRRAGS
jgi:hypothetical protein